MPSLVEIMLIVVMSLWVWAAIGTPIMVTYLGTMSPDKASTSDYIFIACLGPMGWYILFDEWRVNKRQKSAAQIRLNDSL